MTLYKLTYDTPEGVKNEVVLSESNFYILNGKVFVNVKGFDVLAVKDQSPVNIQMIGVKTPPLTEGGVPDK
jgi:hypothetical protein